MAFALVTLIITVLTTLCTAQESIEDKNYCTEDFLFKDIPGGIAKELFQILTTGVIESIIGCKPVEVPEDSINFLLHNRQNPKIPIRISSTNLNEIDPSKPVIFLIHGWLCSANNSKMPEMRDAYLSRYDSNVIIMDWSKQSVDYYTKSYCFLPEISKIAARLICNMNSISNVDLSTLHIVGHSMGGQISGLVGKEVKQQCGKIIGRITGLDPAGPLFQNLPRNRRLYKSDAKSVDVIHSNMGFMGYLDNCGSTDFYPNCGVVQPGCPPIHNINNIDKLMNLPFAVATCSHVRSLEFMVESIVSPKPEFISKKCGVLPALPIIGLCGNVAVISRKTVMGENCPPATPGSKFCLKTNAKSPFARG